MGSLAKLPTRSSRADRPPSDSVIVTARMRSVTLGSSRPPMRTVGRAVKTSIALRGDSAMGSIRPQPSRPQRQPPEVGTQLHQVLALRLRGIARGFGRGAPRLVHHLALDR